MSQEIAGCAPRLCNALFPMTMVQAQEDMGDGTPYSGPPQGNQPGVLLDSSELGKRIPVNNRAVLQNVAVIQPLAGCYRRASGNRHSSNRREAQRAGRSVRRVLSQLGVRWYVCRFAPSSQNTLT